MSHFSISESCKSISYPSNLCISSSLSKKFELLKPIYLSCEIYTLVNSFYIASHDVTPRIHVYLPTFAMKINWNVNTPKYASLMDLSWVMIKPIVLFMKSALSYLHFQQWLQLTRYGRRQLLLWGIVSGPSWGLLAVCQNCTQQLHFVAQFVFSPKKTFFYVK